MPKIIRSGTVQMEDARPIILQAPRRQPGGAALPPAPPSDHRAQRAAEEEAARKALDAREQAARILAEAEARAAALLSEAQASCEELMLNAQREGYEQGVAQGLTEVGVYRQQAAEQMDQCLQDFKNERVALLDELEQDIVDLVFDIVDKVLGVEMKRGTEWIVALVRNALKQLETNETGVMKVAAAQHEKIAAIAEQVMAAGGYSQKVAVVRETGFAPGDCVLETNKGHVDMGVATQIDQLKKAFEGTA